MTEVLDRFPMTKHTGTPMAEFMDGRVYRLVNGVDFHTKNERNGGTTYFYALAKKLGKRVRIHTESYDPLTIVLQARDR